jgi:hypothetical protein
MDNTYHLNGGFKPTTKRFSDLSGPFLHAGMGDKCAYQQ